MTNPYGTPVQAMVNRHNAYPDFFRVAGQQQGGDIDFAAKRDDGEDYNCEKLVAEQPIHEGNSFSSRVVGTGRNSSNTLPSDMSIGADCLHNIVLDIDHDALLIETTTPGHHHLVINRPMPWLAYARILEALFMAGVIERGYYEACMNREASWLRTPWTPKVNNDGL